jgi:hypothetical protein
MTMCGFGAAPAVGKVHRQRFVCPWCRGWGTWLGGERCAECAGYGTTDNPEPGVDLYTDYGDQDPPELKPEPIPRPPGVMRQPCVDCAFRRGSPEMTNQGEGLPGGESPFYCHHGLVRVGTGYLPGSTLGGRPLGALVCANWWALHIDGAPLKVEGFRDPGGNDRSENR